MYIYNFNINKYNSILPYLINKYQKYVTKYLKIVELDFYRENFQSDISIHKILYLTINIY